MIFRFLISVFFMTCMPVSAFSASSNSNDSIVQSIFTLIYNQEFNRAELVLSNSAKELDTFYKDILEIDLHWWRYSISRSKKDAKNLKLLIKEDDKVGNTEEEKIRELIKKSYLMRYERKRYNLIGAAMVKSDINKLLEDLGSEQISLSGKRLKLFELYVSMFQYFDSINPFSILRKSENRLEPLQKMEKYALEEDLIVRTMAHYFLGRIYQKVEKQKEKGKLHFEALTIEFPKNKIFKEYFIDCSN